jgi:hypothetical protein
MKIKKQIVFFIIVGIVLLAVLPAIPVSAASRQATISGPKEAQIGQSFTVTLGFSPAEKTRSSDFDITYDNNLIQLTGISKASNVADKVLPESASGAKSPLKVGVIHYGDGVSADKILYLQFKVIAKGSVTIKITSASDGVDGNTVSAGASRTIELTDASTTTAKTTSPTTTQAPTTTTSTTPAETQPRHQVETVIGKRYDGVDLVVPDSELMGENVPSSFSEVEVEWGDKYLLAYQSESLPYTLYWLSDQEGETRIYLYQEDSQVFVPYLRTEWSSRYYTFALVPEEMVPEGFELTTLSVWEREVAGYRPVEGSFISKPDYDDLLEDDTQDPGERRFELPDTVYLLALRLNDAEEVNLYLYDRGIDSLIRVSHWLVPVAGSFLDPDVVTPTVEPSEVVPSETEEVSETEAPEKEERVGGATIELFGLELPIYLVAGTGALVLLMLAVAVWFFIRAKRAAEFEPDLELEDLSGAESFDPDPVVPVLPVEQEEALPEHLFAQEEEIAEPEEENKEPTSDNGWDELKETLFGREKNERRRPDKRPPGIRPSIHRRVERDDPEDHDEL